MGENKFSVIFDLLKADILSGKYADGRPLPSAPALMRRFGVARATAVAALKELVRCGFATSRRGKGTFPSERTIGLILPGIAYSEFFLPVMSGLSRRCQETGYGLLFGDAYSDDPVNRAAQAKALAEDFARKRVSGVSRHQQLRGRAQGRRPSCGCRREEDMFSRPRPLRGERSPTLRRRDLRRA